MNPNLISFKDLQNWFDCKQVNKVKECLEKSGIKYEVRNGKPVTTWYDVVQARKGVSGGDWENFA